MAAVGDVSAAGALSAFGYNRENFMFDRELRLKKELAHFNFSIDKVKLWREDIREVVGLVETRMKAYLLVNVLMLSFTMMLWNQGQLNYGTPDWLLIGYSVSICGAFIFLSLTVYFALHAAIIAKCAGTRMLTQLVRLPVPTFSEIQACRTYGSNFEKVESKQMFRVPFLLGSQEAFAFGPSGCGCDSTQADEEHSFAEDDDLGVAANDLSDEGTPLCADPWGLELPADVDSIEDDDVGVGYGADVVKLRHIKLVRQAMEWWETYDAFARMCSSIGVNQLMLAITYFILGYALIEVLDAAAAGAGVAVMIMLQEVIASLDMVLTTSQHRVIHLVLVVGPLMAWIGTYLSANRVHDGKVIAAQAVAVVAFLCHGFYVWFLVIFCQVQEQGHAMMPSAFRAVLFMDVFGWIDKRTDDRKSADLAHFQELPGLHRHESFLKSTSKPFRRQTSSMVSDIGAEGELGKGENNSHKIWAPWATDYVDHDDEASPETLAWQLRSHGSIASKKLDRTQIQCSVHYDELGYPYPVKSSDFRAQGAHDDMQHVPGAPFVTDDVRGDDPPPPGYFDSLSYVSLEARTRSNMGPGDQCKIVTGHDHEAPGMLPWTIFKGATYALICVWAFAAMYSLLSAWDILRVVDPFPYLDTDDFGIPVHDLLAQGALTVPKMQKLDVAWPHPHFLPTSFSCDASGSQFAVTDGLSVFSGQLSREVDDVHIGRTRGLRQKHSGRSLASIEFADVVTCRQLRGQAVQDVAVLCAEGMPEASNCQLLALYDHGRRIARCALLDMPEGNGRNGNSSTTGMDAPSMGLRLEDLGSSGIADTDKLEYNGGIASKFSTSPACKGCIIVGTTSGQVVELQPNLRGTDFIPVGITREEEHHKNGLLKSHIRAVRSFNTGHLALLHASSRAGAVQVINVGEGSTVHVIGLPTDKSIENFCIGGDHLYILTRGDRPEIWYTTIPQVLRQPASQLAKKHL